MTSATPKARKPYTCAMCGGTIPAGTRYEYRRCTPWDHPENDGFSSIKAHIVCYAFWQDGYGADQDWMWDFDHHHFVECLLDKHKIKTPLKLGHWPEHTSEGDPTQWTWGEPEWIEKP